jgi:hypothetical protein
MPITHATAAAGTNAGTGEIHKEQWNADHTVTGLGGGALVLLEQHSASSSATLDFTSFISADYDEYVFEMVNLVPATNAVNLYVRMGTGGGPTWDSGSNYSYADYRFVASVASGVGGGTSQTQIILNDSTDTVSNSSNTAVSGRFSLFDPQTTGNHKRIRGELAWGNSSAIFEGNDFIGLYQSTTAVTGIRFLFSSGNIASGTIRVYGVAKATIAPTGGGLTLLEQHTASSSATLDFTTCISSTYDVYQIVLTDIAPATNGADLLMYVGTGGGPTWDTGNNYIGGGLVMDTSTGATGTWVATTGGAKLGPGISNNAGYGTYNGELIAHALLSTSHRKSFHGTSAFITSTPQGLIAQTGFQWLTTGTAVSGLQFKCSSGNIASGTIRVYGVAK